jgi:hypothetical protein
MNLRRILLYLAVLVAAVVFFALYHRWFSWYLLVLILLLIPFDLLLSLPGMLARRISLQVPKVVMQGADEALAIKTQSYGMFPAGPIRVKIRESAEEHSSFHRISCSSKQGSYFAKEIDAAHSGFTTFTYERFWVSSLLGLFALPFKPKGRAESVASVLILPAAKKPPHIPVLPKATRLRPARCGVFSEEHDLRSFRSGDPLKSIHWKLSAKYDSLIVREPLIPESHSYLVHINPWQGAEDRDIIVGRLHWVCEYLLGKNQHFYLRLGHTGVITKISNESESMDYLRYILGDSTVSLPAVKEKSTHFTWTYRVDSDE